MRVGEPYGDDVRTECWATVKKTIVGQVKDEQRDKMSTPELLLWWWKCAIGGVWGDSCRQDSEQQTKI